MTADRSLPPCPRCRELEVHVAELESLVRLLNEQVPKAVRHWSLTTLRDKLIKIGAKVTKHSKYVTFQLAEVAVTRNLFAAILNRIAQLAIPPPVLVCGMPV